MRKIISFSYFMIFILLFFLAGCPTSTNSPKNEPDIAANFAPEVDNTWTFMIYLDADNDLERFGIVDFFEMVSGMASAKNDNINLIVQMDRIPNYSLSTAIGGTDWEDTQRYQITSTGYTRLDIAPNLDELNMGEKATLSDFIDFCTTDYIADNYALILWNHGGGSRSGSKGEYTGVEKEICIDDTSNDCLYLDEVQVAVAEHFSAADKLTLIGFDACIMATVEVAYEFRDLADYMAGSMANEWGDGWDYNTLFAGMKAGEGKNPSGEELSKLIVKTYRNSTCSYSNLTQSAINLSNMDTLKDKIDEFAVALYAENKQSDIEGVRDLTCHFYGDDDSIAHPYFDLSDLAYQVINSNKFSTDLNTKAQSIITELEGMVVASYAGSYYGGYYGADSDVSRGLSIFFSRGASHYTNQWWYTLEDTQAWNGKYYGNIDFCNSDGDGTVETWRELFECWYDTTNLKTPSTW